MLVGHAAVETNPFLEVRLPKKDAARRLLVSDEELVTLLEAATRQPCAFPKLWPWGFPKRWPHG
jgi:hypothetical protein